MGDSNSTVGRIARFGEIYVSISSNNEDVQTCEVLPLLVPNEPVTSTSATTVALESLVFYPEESFSTLYPEAVNCSADSSMPGDTGVIYDLTTSELIPQLQNSGGKWVLSSSSRVTGARTVPDVNGQVHPTTVIRNEVTIKIDADNGIVEFEDIFFDVPGTYKTAVQYSSGKHVVFRRCRFSASNGAEFYVQADYASQVVVVNVTFERCTFHKCQHGLRTNGQARILMLHCFISDCSESGALVSNSRVVAKHCGFHRNQYGVQSVGMYGHVDLSNCTFINNKYGVNNNSRATCLMKGCRIGSTSTGSCLEGVQVSGPKRSLTHIDNCVIYKCDTGVVIESGNADFTMLNSKIITQSAHNVGVEVRFDAIGNMDFADCDIPNYEIWSGKKCFVTIDGKSIPPKAMRAIKQRIEECLDDPPLRTRRLLKRAGVGTVVCAGCGKVEPSGVRFKKCMPCFNACYCSKACQTEDWVFHKSKCVQEDEMS